MEMSDPGVSQSEAFAAALAAAGRRLLTAENVDEVAAVATEAALALCPSATAASLYTVDRTGRWLLPQGPAPEGLASRWGALPLDAGPAQRAFVHGEVAALSADEMDSLALSAEDGLDRGSLLLAPLLTGEEPLGLLALWCAGPRPGPQPEAERLGVLGKQVCRALVQLLPVPGRETLAPGVDTIVDSLAQGLVLLDRNGRVCRLNPALERTLGLSPDQVPLPCGSDEARCPALLRQLVDPSRADVLGPYVVMLDLPEKGPATLEVLPSALGGQQGGVACLVLDVTPDRAASLDRSLFIAQVAHELRAPIQHIMGFASIISDVSELPDDTLQRFLGHINDESRRLARLVDDLAELTRIEQSRFSIDASRVRVDQMLADLVARLAPSAAAKDIALILHSPVTPSWARTDAVRLEQVVGNLVENALKYVPIGGEINVSLQGRGEQWLIGVKDSGPGIPEAALPHIFECYFQAPQREGLPRKGMGLGLYISREIIHALGGDIGVESAAGQGCTFTVTLPRE